MIPAEDVALLAPRAERWTAWQLIHWAAGTFGRRAAVSTGFGAEGMVILEMAWKQRLDLHVFTVDTGFLFAETYALMDMVEQRYGVRVERLKPGLSPEGQYNVHGPELWKRDPDRCCDLRKVQPLQKRLDSLGAWITGIRREQSSTRKNAKKIEWDTRFNLVKINPLADWTGSEVRGFLKRHKVPYNPLHDRNYPSIGCIHCTRPVEPGEHSRSGRWQGFAKTECGIHSGTRSSER